jgi:CheY-like chemotaxis protein
MAARRGAARNVVPNRSDGPSLSKLLLFLSGNCDGTDCTNGWNPDLRPKPEKQGVPMSKKLMVIDDAVGFTRVIEMIAQQLGFSVRSLNDPMQAIAAFVEFKPDVLVLDMIMPEKDGIDVLHEILTTGIPASIVLTSGYGESYLRLAKGLAKFHQIPDVSVLHKPFRRSELVRLLTDLCSARGGA